MRLFVLAGGFGTRIRSVSDGKPKALIPVGGVPLLELQIKNWKRQGIDTFTFLVFYEADQIIEFIERERFGLFTDCKVDYVREPSPLGTGGAIVHALTIYSDSEFLVVNADTWLGGGMAEIVKAASPVIGVVYQSDVSRFGAVEISEQGQVLCFNEKSGVGGSGYINAGVYKLNRDSFDRLKEKTPFSIEEQVLREESNRGRLTAVTIDSTFMDIGIPEDYALFDSWVADGTLGSEMDVLAFQVSSNASVAEALSAIEHNAHNAVFVCDGVGKVVGLITDGDVRRYLLDGGKIEDSVSGCTNYDFVWAFEGEPRESLLKKLDARVKLIPVLDQSRKLISVVNKDHVPIASEGSIYSRSRSPVRISFGGGGSDVTHYFSGSEDGAVISTTISLYSHATLRVRSDSKVHIFSNDLQDELVADSLTSAHANPGKFGLILAVLRAIDPDFGFELYIHSDFPVGSGLGGSAAVSSAIIGCFNEFRRDKWNLHEIAEIAYQSERHYLGVAGGWQDQYATVFGGFNFMEFRLEQNIVHPLRINEKTLNELEESLVVCDTGVGHDSGNIHDDQRRSMEDSDIKSLVEANVQLCYSMRNQLLRGELISFGSAMDAAWNIKRQLSDKISNLQLDEIYRGAVTNGALGGKLLGAGGGGFFLFFAAPFRKQELMNHLSSTGLKIRPFRFEHEGLVSWTMREEY